MEKKNVAYLRVSTETQTEKYGLDIQREKITEYCEKNQIKIDKWYVDGGYSGSTMRRPQITKLLKDAEKGEIQTVYVYKLDRVSRDVTDTLTLLYKTLPQYGVKLVSMVEEIRNQNPMDRVMVTVNAAMNQYEREVIRMRMSAGMVERVKSGLFPGGGNIPFGYYYDRNDGILHPKADEAEKVKKIFQLYNDGYSTSKITNMIGIKNEKSVIDILKRKTYIGLLEYNGEVYQGKQARIIDDETFYKTQAYMKKRSRGFIVSDNMLTGLCWCGKCGARMRYQKWGSYHKLVCYTRVKGSSPHMAKADNCDNPYPNAADVEREVEDCVKQFSIKLSNQSQEEENNIKIIQDAICSSERKLRNLYNLYSDNPSEILVESINTEESKLKKLKETLISEQKLEKGNLKAKTEQIRKSTEIWNELTTSERNKLLKEIIEKIIITNGNISIYFKTV